MSTKQCPHGGERVGRIVEDDGELYPYQQGCGVGGYLCPACREDRADARTARLVEGLVLAGQLASMPEEGGDRWSDGWGEDVTRASLRCAAALRKRITDAIRDLWRKVREWF